MDKKHEYLIRTKWNGNKGEGTSNYLSYERSHTIHVVNKPDIHCSSDPVFNGDKTKHNPEELFVAAISSCHMLWYLHLCSEAGVVVVDYLDNATGTLLELSDGSGHFTEVTLNPVVTVAEKSMLDKAKALHTKADKMCFLANSCNFEIHHRPICKVYESGANN